MLHGDGFNEGLLNELFELGRELGPVAGDLLAEEDGGELADVGGFGPRPDGERRCRASGTESATAPETAPSDLPLPRVRVFLSLSGRKEREAFIFMSALPQLNTHNIT